MLDYKELSLNPYHLNKNVSIANAPGHDDKVYGNIFEYTGDQYLTGSTKIGEYDPDSPLGKIKAEEEAIAHNKQIQRELEKEAQDIYDKDVGVGTVEDRMIIDPETQQITLKPIDDTIIKEISNMDDMEGDFFNLNPTDTLKVK